MSDAAPAKKIAAKPKKVAEHPPVAQMVNTAISSLKERKGASLAAVKKYVAANNKVDIEKLGPFIRRYLKKAVADGTLLQTKGTGASGSFKLAKPAKEEKPKKKPAAKKAAKKPVAAKKTPKKAAKKSPKKAAKKAKSPKKEKKAKKSKVVKPKKPKTKPAKSPKKATKPKAKKAAAKK
jgi:hypothetical protein